MKMYTRDISAAATSKNTRYLNVSIEAVGIVVVYSIIVLSEFPK